MANNDNTNEVKAWQEEVIIPTYSVGIPEKNPMFLEKRVYQGSSGAVYPHAIIETISDKKKDKAWNAIYLENRYLKIMILPELGGRIHMAYDKTNDRHFVYHNHVIKPALVGLTGPWISGGIEFNWPQHHRPSTFEPVDFKIEEHSDGSKTVWCNEVERMYRTRGMAGFRLYPDKAYLEINVKIFNRTPYPQTFLWWANPALHVNDDFQSVFPPDVHAVFDHGKRDVSAFPIAKGKYYNVDYSNGVDISWYKNIPVPTSYMAIKSNYDFVGGYEHDTKGGIIHIANHHISPGKKQWTWGNGDFGKAWERNLTDEDGPYVELMCGVYTDNQPDFSWLMPGEEKSFNQYFLPYKDVGLVKNATKDALLNLEVNGDHAVVKVYTTSEIKGATVQMDVNDKPYFTDKFNSSPEFPFEKTIDLVPGVKPEEILITVLDSSGHKLVAWQPDKTKNEPVPDPASPPKKPADIPDNEQLYLTGLHIEQYHHATYDPTEYYREALKRNPSNVRNNNAMGLWFLRRGQFKKAEQHFRKSLETLNERNPNPYNGEPFYNLGVSLKMQGKHGEAWEAFYKSTWNAALQDVGFFNLAQIACINGNLEEALQLVSQSLNRNSSNHKAHHLEIAILRKLDMNEEAMQKITQSLSIDPFNFGALFEQYLLEGKDERLTEFHTLIRKNIQNYIEFALDYAHAGLFDEAIQLLDAGVKVSGTKIYPMALYYLSWFANLKGDQGKSMAYLKKAASQSPDYCFPSRTESVAALMYAAEMNPDDSLCHYYLGNFWYASRQYSEAIECWEKSKKSDETFPTVRRNLSLAYFNKKKDPEKAILELKKAFVLNPSDSRILFELDQLYKRINIPVDERLDFLQKYPELVNQRDDLYLEQILLQNLSSDFPKALELIMSRNFHPWEGGEGKVTGQYLTSHIELAKKSILARDYQTAIDHLNETVVYPSNLGEGKLFGKLENDINFWFGIAYQGLGDNTQANSYWEKAAEGQFKPEPSIYYINKKPDKIFYQGLALMMLDRTVEARNRFNSILDYGYTHMTDIMQIDYFAISLPDMLIWDSDLRKKNTVHCNYMIGLGNLGLGQVFKATEKLLTIVEMENHHQGAHIHSDLIKNFMKIIKVYSKKF